MANAVDSSSRTGGDLRPAVVAAGRIAVLPVFGVTIFLSAVLVFGVQPIAARLLLPYFGGSPAVWSASSLFFQLALLAGYGYSYLITRYLEPRRQPLVHVPVLALPLLLLPLALPLGDGSFTGLPPAIGVMAVLATGLGLPFVAASTTGPLLQRWFSFTGHRWALDPYFLYAASNTGSLLVLLAYPFILEPQLNLEEQKAWWSIGYVVFAALAATCGAMVLRRTPGRPLPAVSDADADHEPLSWLKRGRWLLLAAVPSALSLGVTQHISTDIAAIPLLWIAPLALYLLSFVLAFSRNNPLTAPVAGRLLPVPLAGVLITPFLDLPVWLLLGVHLAFLFLAATMCHARLASERPQPSRLTEYYLLLSVGGAIGGAFVSLIAPIAFDAVWEYPIAIVAALLLRPRIRSQTSRRILAGVAATVVVAAGLMLASTSMSLPTWIPLLALGLVVVAIARWRVAAALVTAALLGYLMVGGGEPIHTDRTFFGVYRVTDEGMRHSLVHGTTVHGIQFSDPERREVPTAYYHRSGPIGQVFAARDGQLERVAVVGLGVGTLASYGQPGEEMTFYEIDPAIVSLARDPDLFTYIADSDASVETIVADGRLGLAADQTTYDLLVIDAFSSDAIPVHLVTREAVALYADRVTDEGLIAFHITNRFVDLEPVLGAIANSLGLHALVQGDHAVSAEDALEGKRPSTWVLLATNSESLQPFMADDRWRPASADPPDQVWTDGYSDLIGALR